MASPQQMAESFLPTPADRNPIPLIATAEDGAVIATLGSKTVTTFAGADQNPKIIRRAAIARRSRIGGSVHRLNTQMKTILARAAASVSPLMILMLPKCPLCLMPLLAAAGIGIPAGPLLDALAIAIVTCFTLLLLRGWSSRAMRGLANGGAMLLIAGRLAAFPVVTWIGVGAMVLTAALRIRYATRGSCATHVH